MIEERNSPKTVFLQAARLIVRWPNGGEDTFPLKAESARIGRGLEGNDLAVPPLLASISRQHLLVKRLDGLFYASDLGSRNGVFVNGKKIGQPVRLNHGDEIRIGEPKSNQQVTLIFEAGTESALQDALRVSAVSTLTPRADLPPGAPHLTIRWPNGSTADFPLEKETVLVGRDPQADLRLPAALTFVSARQFEVQKRGEGFTVRDLNSANGTFLNNQRLEPNVEVPLPDNGILRVGDDDFGVSVAFTFIDPSRGLEGFQPAGASAIQKTHALFIGRDASCQMRLDYSDVSRRHARIQQVGEKFIIVDLQSTNGTFVNGTPVKAAELRDGDLIQIGATLLMFSAGQVQRFQSMGMRVDVQSLNQEVGARRGKLKILDDINLSILPREFVAIVGGSGAGKSTLLNALIGYRPGKGKVQFNGQDFYAEYERYRSQLGFVPQSDILHTSLSVERALDYAARLRLPGSLSREERKRRIDAVLETVSMNTETLRKTRIGNLSGGQRKRVSIAAELLADPKLIFLDEATSGLDPGLEKKLMYTLRRMADEGRTVVLITHATSNIVQTDHVAFLSQGKLIYFGPSQEALDFFGVEDFADIYERIENHGEEWRRVFRTDKPAHYERYVTARQATLRAVPRQALPTPRFGLAD
ncbi:MAG: FHA domain-containing protein, partial [Chloroflexota bacterium]